MEPELRAWAKPTAVRTLHFVSVGTLVRSGVVSYTLTDAALLLRREYNFGGPVVRRTLMPGFQVGNTKDGFVFRRCEG